MEKPTPSNHLRTVLMNYACNFAAIQDMAIHSHIKVEPQQLIAIASIATLLDYLSPSAKIEALNNEDYSANLQKVKSLAERLSRDKPISP